MKGVILNINQCSPCFRVIAVSAPVCANFSYFGSRIVLETEASVIVEKVGGNSFDGMTSLTDQVKIIK